jgi:hypothetical protein
MSFRSNPVNHSGGKIDTSGHAIHLLTPPAETVRCAKQAVVGENLPNEPAPALWIIFTQDVMNIAAVLRPSQIERVE